MTSVTARVPAAVSGVVLAGGRSRRLGRDKRFVTVDGTTLLARSVGALASVVTEVTIVVADATDVARVRAATSGVMPAERLHVAVDARTDVGPAAGLETALTLTTTPWVLVIATDHPHLAPPLLALLAATAAGEDGGADGVVGSAARAVAIAGPRGPEPLLAAYHRDARPTVTALLDGGVRRLVAVLAALDPQVIPARTWRALDPAGASLRDVDLPTDLPTDPPTDPPTA